MFFEHRDNISGLTLTIAYALFFLELIRFISFVLIWLEREKNGAPIWDTFLNIVFTIVGEIYAHTQLRKMLKNEMEMRLYGRRYEDFDELYHYFSSIRSNLEYFAP